MAKWLKLSSPLELEIPRERVWKGKGNIEPETLHDLLAANNEVLVFEVRVPLDLLAYSEVIPGATRVPPKEIVENPALISKTEDVVVYCTCLDEKNSREILRRARSLNFWRLKILRGGLAGSKAKGYAVEPYKNTFRLETKCSSTGDDVPLKCLGRGRLRSSAAMATPR